MGVLIMDKIQLKKELTASQTYCGNLKQELTDLKEKYEKAQASNINWMNEIKSLDLRMGILNNTISRQAGVIKHLEIYKETVKDQQKEIASLNEEIISMNEDNAGIDI